MLDKKNNAAITDIVTIGSPILTTVTQKIEDPLSKEIQDLIPVMFDVMRREKGIGLAAPQIGISKQIAVIEYEKTKIILINPQITDQSDEMIIFPEGCLSIPHQELDILRHQKISIRYADENGKNTILKASGFLAVACQHEIDHLNGILITDRYEHQEELRKAFNIPQKIYEKNS